MAKLTAFLIVLALFSVNASAQSEVQVLRATPTGNVEQPVRQITFTFNQKMVPVGEMERTAEQLGVSVSPAANCRWRWLEPTTLSCELDEKDSLKLATNYVAVIKAGLSSESGAKLKKPYTLKFTTARPTFSYVQFLNWKSPSTPLVQLHFNQPVSYRSVAKSFVFAYGNEKTAVVVERAPYDNSPAPFVLQSKSVLFSERKNDAGAKDDSPIEQQARETWVVSPVRELANNANISLELEAGLESAFGPLRGVAKRAVNFDTFSSFDFVGIRCWTSARTGAAVQSDEESEPSDIRGELVDIKTSGVGKCQPMREIYLLFSSPVLGLELKNKLVTTPSLYAEGKKDEVWGELPAESNLSHPHRRGELYTVLLPNAFLARRNYRIQFTEIRDQFDRSLALPVDFQFETEPRPPRLVIPNSIGVLEKHEQTDIPLFVTNLTKLDFDFQALTTSGFDRAQRKTTPFSQDVKDLAYASPMGARELLKNRSGVVTGAVNAPGIPREREFFVQVTPFQVLAKYGHYNTTVWVTDMKTGLPVADAKVDIVHSNYISLDSALQPRASAQTSANGLATLKGRADLDPKNQTPTWRSSFKEPGFMVRVSKGEDQALLPLDDNFGVQSYRINSNIYTSYEKKWGHLKAWGTTAQSVYRAGDKVQFKVYVRNANNLKFEAAPKGIYTLTVTDPEGKEAFKKTGIKLNEFGAFDGEFTTNAQTSPVGWYEFGLQPDFREESLTPLKVLISDFNPIPFKVETTLDRSFYGKGAEVKVGSRATLHAGGPFANSDVRVTALFKPKYFVSENPKTKDFNFGGSDQSESTIGTVENKLDASGHFKSSFKLESLEASSYGNILIETAVSDDRGKRVASLASAPFSGLTQRIGLKPLSWTYKTNEEGKILFVVADNDGKPISGVNAKLKYERRETKIAKVKGAGNAYLNEYTYDWVADGECEKRSEKEPVACAIKPTKPGTYRVTATIKDSNGSDHSNQTFVYAVGPGEVLWGEGDDFSLPIEAEKKEYRVGEKARFLVKNPLPGAKALITAERYGVMKTWIQTFSDSTAIIEVPVEADFVPGFYLSVALVSPRVERGGAQTPGVGEIDLGKPAFRMGLVEVPVVDPYKEMIVTAQVDKTEYRPREKVKVKFSAKPRNLASKDHSKEPIELAVVVLDEAVLSLVPSGAKSYDPYAGFYSLDGLDVNTYNLLTRIVGRQKFEKKGATPGGSGGMSQDMLLRNDFRFVSYWNPSLKTNAQGEAEAEFTLPDNLTGWRILAMGATPTDRLGLGQKNFKVNQPIEIRPVMPNQVSEGDRFKAGFSVMNRTSKAKKIKVAIKAEGTIAKSPTEMKQEVELAANERRTLFVDVQASRVASDRNIQKGNLKFTAIASDGKDQDATEHSVPVLKSRSLEVAAVHGSTIEGKASETIAVPKNIHPDVGAVEIIASASVMGNLDEPFRYVRDYAYPCWEQKLTVATMASHFVKLQKYIPNTKWPEAQTLPEKMLAQAVSHQAPNGGMAFYVAKDEYVSPYLSAYTALAFQWLKAAGHKVPTAVENKLNSYLSNLLKTKAVPTFYDEGMEASVRAVALNALVKSKKLGASDVSRYLAHMPKMSLFGKANYLQAALEVQSASNMQNVIKATSDAILAASNQTSGKFFFNETWSDAWERVLATPTRDNCSILSAMTAFAQTPAGRMTASDVPLKLSRSLLQSRKKDATFGNTQENIFCLQGMIDYSKVYEKTAPDMSVKAAFAGKVFGEGELKGALAPVLNFSRPLTQSDVGAKAKLDIERKGQGRLYYDGRVSYSPIDGKASGTNAGIDIKREYYVERNGKFERLQNSAQVKRGELIRVELFISIPAARNFVAVLDPLPGGFEAVNRDLANESTVDAEKGSFIPSGGSSFFQFSDWIGYQESFWSFYHKELRFDSARFYSEYLAPGHYRLSYTAQAIAVGEFKAGPARAEEMYDQEVYGKTAPTTFTVTEK